MLNKIIILFFCLNFALYSENSLNDSLDEEKNEKEENKKTFIEEHLEFQGFLRQMFLGTKSSLPSEYNYPQNLLSSYSRARFGGSFFYNAFTLNFLGNFDFIFGNFTNSPEFDFYWKNYPRNRAMVLEKYWDEKDYLLRSDVHRLNFVYNSDKFTLSVGRQVISWGQGRFLNPINLVTPISPFTVDIEDLQGSDSLYFTYYLSSLNSIEVVVSPYRRSNDPDLKKISNKDTNALLKSNFTINKLDVSFLGGNHFHSWVWGFDSSLTIWDASIRLAYLGRSESNYLNYPYYEGDKLPPSVIHQMIFGISYAFFGKIRTNFEIFGNSGTVTVDKNAKRLMEEEAQITAGLKDPLWDDGTFYRTTGRIITKKPLLLELSLGYDFFDMFTTDIFIIADPIGKSVFIGPVLNYNFSDNAVIAFGAQTFAFTDKDSEFYKLKPLVYSFLRYHF